MGLVPLLSLLAPRLLPIAPKYPVEPSETQILQPPLEQQAKTSVATDFEHEAPTQSPTLPTPPSSSRASSVSVRRNCDEGNDRVSQPRDTGTSKASCVSILQAASRNDVSNLDAHGERQTATANPPPKSFANYVHAAHFSSPTSISSSICPTAHAEDVSMHTKLSSLNSDIELSRLTGGMNTLDVKATPPITPRTLSNDGTEASRRTTSPNDRSTGTTDSNGTSTPRSGAPVPPPKGELVVTISGARGLRPSFDPYAVCVFEWIESIAHHHKLGMLAADDGAGRRELTVGGLPISRTGSSTGRSMAIPMKSRQGSTTSLSDQKEFKNGTEVTDPRWDHEAVLCVAKLSLSMVQC